MYNAITWTNIEPITKGSKFELYGKSPENDVVKPRTPTFINQNCNFASLRLCKNAWAKEGTKRYERPKIIIATKP